jgi:four helix bundle protein
MALYYWIPAFAGMTGLRKSDDLFNGPFNNYRATCLSQSKASFVAKISIVLEEADETAFWLEFIKDEKLLKKNLVEPLLKEAGELTKIFASSRMTASTKY